MRIYPWHENEERIAGTQNRTRVRFVISMRIFSSRRTVDVARFH